MRQNRTLDEMELAMSVSEPVGSAAIGIDRTAGSADRHCLVDAVAGLGGPVDDRGGGAGEQAPPAPMSAPTRPRDDQWGLWPCPAICQMIEPATIANTLAISPQCMSPPVMLSHTLLPGRPVEFGLTLTVHAEPAAA